MSISRTQWLWCAAVVVSITCALGGLYMVWAYDHTPRVPAAPQAERPGTSRLARADDRTTSGAARTS